MNVHMPVEELCGKVKKLMEDSSYGNIVRIKGFLKAEDGTWMELNATHQNMTVQQIERGQEVIIVIGEGLVEDKISAVWK